MKLYIESLKMHFKSILEYKASFIISFISQFLIFFSYYFIILALFNKFDNIKGFSVYEVLLIFSIIQFGYSFNEVFARGVDRFDDLIVDGSFDRLLLRPRSIILQVLCSQVELVKLSRLLQAVIIFFIAISHLDIEFSVLKVICLILMIISSIAIFFSVFLTMASYCFFTVQALEVRNLFTDGGKHMAQYPMGIFRRGIMLFFTFIIPYAFVNYYPLLFFLGRSDNLFYCFSPLIVLLYLIPAFLIFRFGMKKYTSVGS